MPANLVEYRDLNRTQSGLKVTRAADKAVTITGYAAVFYRAGDSGTEFEIFDDLVERILPGAFDKALVEDDVRGLVNHSVGSLIGRTKNNTLKLSVDSIGLRYEITVPDTQAGRDVVTSIERGDLDGSSFGFGVWGKRGKVTWAEEVRNGRRVDVREIREVELFDVGPVTFPAYASTTATRDACSSIVEERRLLRERQSKHQAEVVAVLSRAAEI